MFEPIAIVGRSCILPGAPSPDALWEAVAEGRDLLSTVPGGRWGLSPDLALTDDPSHSDDRAWSDRGGYVTDFDVPELPDEWRGLDRVFQWSLHTAREALRQAGHHGDSDRVGAVLGNLSFPSSRMSRFAEHVWLDRPAEDPRNRFMSGLPVLLLAQHLGIRGGAFALDAACASSLYAIKLACDQLHDRTVDLALAGAVCCSDDLFIHVGFCALDAMSRTGRSRPFHRAADGLVPAEGAAVLALKRLEDAMAANDHVYGVIRGVGLSNDGRGRGLLAPASAGQRRALQAAWDHAGVDPQRLGLVECHATGTQVGDATELETLQAVFGDICAEVPVGSLKSNLGHLITAAGAAAVIKVLGAFSAERRPATLHVDAPTDALEGTCLRLLDAEEGWSSDAPRVAAVNAFGFGGNNAHLILEEVDPSAAPTTAAATPAAMHAEIAVVGLGVRAAGLRCAADLATLLQDGRSRITPGVPARGTADDIVLDLQQLKFPPRDLEQTLAQQLLVLDAAMEASAGRTLPTDRTAVLIGAQSDPEVCRYGARWRFADWHRGASRDATEAGRDAIVPVLRSAGVVGNMPNIPANRIGSQLDLGGPGFTLAAEEHSGLVALRVGVRMLRAGEVDVALVGAVDLSAEPVHEAAAAAVLGPTTAGDAAVVLTLKRRDDAERDGDPVYALLAGTDASLTFGHQGVDLGRRIGRAHAALPLLHVAAAVLACATATRPAAGGPASPWTGPRVAEVRAVDMTGTEQRVGVTAAHSRAMPPPARPAPAGRPVTFRAHPPAIDPPAREGSQKMQPMPTAPTLPPVQAEDASGRAAGGSFVEPPPVMRPPPELHRISEREAPDPPSVRRAPPARIPPPAPFRPAAPSPAPPSALPAPMPSLAHTSSRGAVAPAHLQQLAQLHRQLAGAHREYLERQTALQTQFLALRQRTTEGLLQAYRARGTTTAPPLVAPPAHTVPLPAARPAPAAPVVLRPPAAVVPVDAPTALPGPKYDRAQLESLASEQISRTFGPMFAVQDDFPRQVRMPEPPLLLADRVTGIDAEPGSMTTGTIWTETDVLDDSWYVHDGTMPAGVMIEAGQADLLLISWLGADFRNRGERVYRLLGCRLTYRGGLPGPGDTMHYEIHVDGHANIGDTRIFFFHSDCTDSQGRSRLEVREGQAGFFSDAELADSNGILWSAETGEHDATARLDAPKVRCTRSSFDNDQVMAFAHGDGFTCFGPGFERLQTHVRTPRIAPPPMSFWSRVVELDVQGGPWGRGYFKAEQDITPSDWFFGGHFKDDPCMPGTMMFEACLQAIGFYMTSLGYTIDKDGWTFEPVPDLEYDLQCRGQVTPTSKYLSYEVFVEEVHDGPWPVVYADILCTVDGLKAFWARRVGVRLRPDYPITSRPQVLAGYVDPVVVAEADGFPFGYASLIACAWGKPSDAFGPMYRPFDGGRHCARLPGPPYHFMSRVTRIDGAVGGMEVGTSIELEYDIPEDAWYFDENGHRTMPFAVLLEAALQPCGWIACYVGSALTTESDLYFRNLDGTATWTAECFESAGTLTTKAKITSISQSAGMIIEAFEVECFLGDQQIYTMDTVFGFFPGAALANQIGITPSDEDRARLHAPSDFAVDLTERPARYCGGVLRLPKPMLLMLDRVSGFWPSGGKEGLGKLRSEKDVDPSEWFFKAHFFTDPVQPGSLGIEAMIQLLQFFMLHTDMHQGLSAPRFEPLMLGRATTWKYRGQVVPENQVIRCELDIVEIGEDEHGRFAVADAWLWVDDLRIYGCTQLGMRIVDDPAPPSGRASPADQEEVVDPAIDEWIVDHCPTWTIPALPAMSMVDRLAQAAVAVSQGVVVEVRDVRVHGWVKVEDPTRLRTEVRETRPVADGVDVDVALLVWRDKADQRLSRFEPAAEGTVRVAPHHPAAPTPLAPLAQARSVADPYASGALFHGPAFHYVQALALGPAGATAILDAKKGSVPAGTLGQGLLDGVLHAIPHDDLHGWTSDVAADQAAYPHHIRSLRFYGPTPQAEIRLEARFVEMVEGPGGVRLPRLRVQAIDLTTEQVWLELDLVEVLLPKGPIGAAPAADRVAFLRDRLPVPGLGLSTRSGELTVASTAAIKQSDWLPGTVRAVYRAEGPLTEHVAVADHIAAIADVHPGTVALDGSDAISSAMPLTRWPVQLTRADDRVSVGSTGDPRLDLDPVRAFWDDYFQLGRWPVEDLYYGLIERFVRRVHVQDPDAHARIHGHSVLYLANHQVGIESVLFSILVSGLHGVNTMALAKAEHQQTWLGQLISHCFDYPNARDPKVITFFDRNDKASLPTIIGQMASEMVRPGKSVLVHVEGTRSLECTTPVLKMSGAFLDLALQVGAPVVPVRFVGGLPAQTMAHRLEYPYQLGKQDIYLGRPMLPGELEQMRYKDRKEAVVAAINDLGPKPGEEVPSGGHEAQQQLAIERAARTGATAPHVVLLQVLEAVAPRTEAIERVVQGMVAGELHLADTPEDRWLGVLARLLYGPDGPRIID